MENKNAEVKLIPCETGTKLGYEDYHGEIYLNHNLLCTWDYDKNQQMYISSIKDGKTEFSRKRFYSRSVAGLLPMIKKYLINNPQLNKTL